MTYEPQWLSDQTDETPVVQVARGPEIIGKQTVNFVLTVDQCSALSEAAGEVEYVLNNAAAIFEMLQLAIVNGQDDAGITATMEFSAKALRRFAENEGQQIGRLDTNLRAILSEAAKRELAQ